MKKLLAELVKHFPGWKIDPTFNGDHDTWRGQLLDGEGRGVFIRHDRKRLDISGKWPTSVSAPYETLHITAADDKPAVKIAADIKRRFLPWYLEKFAEQQEKASKQAAYDAGIMATRAELIGILGPDSVCNSARRLYGPSHTYFDIQGPDSIRLECRGNFTKQAIKGIIRLLQQCDKEEGKKE